MARCYTAITTGGYHVVVSDRVVAEFRDVVSRKFTARMTAAEAFISSLHTFADVVVTPSDPVDDESMVRDPKDQPILRAARHANCNLMVTGDKDLLKADVSAPRILSPAEFLTSETNPLSDRVS